ncbi:4Fe-4S binding protein [uncultured Paraglaciecola sp.]
MCVDCSLCVPECPVEAIFQTYLPSHIWLGKFTMS